MQIQWNERRIVISASSSFVTFILPPPTSSLSRRIRIAPSFRSSLHASHAAVLRTAYSLAGVLYRLSVSEVECCFPLRPPAERADAKDRPQQAFFGWHSMILDLCLNVTWAVVAQGPRMAFGDGFGDWCVRLFNFLYTSI